MAILASLVVVLLLAGVAGAMIWSANRRARRRAREAARLAREREAKEKELLERLGRLKKKSDLDAATAAIREDPGRAARVVAKMMRKKD